MLLVILYLAAIVVANLTVARLGPSAAVVVAFFLIGLDLTTRDGLHERWRGRGLWRRMLALVGGGSLLSYVLNTDSGSVAVASLVAFAAAGLTDAVVYQALIRRSRFMRVNASNALAAAVDSLIFPTVAFGVLMPGIVLGQFAAKVAGGYVWSLLLRRTLWQESAPLGSSPASNV